VSDGSLNAATASAVLLVNNGSVAISGSTTITGSLVVTNTINAQTLIVEYITSSVIVTSGSTKFGDSTADTHQFTGSITVSGSYTITGTSALNGDTTIVGSLTVSTGSAVELRVSQTGVAIGNIVSDAHRVTGSMNITGSLNIVGNTLAQTITASAILVSGSGTQRLTVVGSGSAQPIFTVQGSQGELFSIVDSLSGSLFSVNDISGLPILEVFSDSTTLIGNYNAPVLNTSKRISTTVTGSFTVYSIATASYDGMFVEYTAKSGSNVRAGSLMSVWSGSQVDVTDTSLNGFGNTTGIVFGGIISGSNFVITGSVNSVGWTVKTIIRAI
jgi:hypothetical protein